MSTVLRIVIRSAAGPRIGYGHLVRARTLAKALPAHVSVSVRGNGDALSCARRLRLPLASSSLEDALRTVGPALLVVDDPSAAHARRALRAGRAAGVPVASVHDLGMAAIESDLIVDGTIAPIETSTRAAAGPRFAVLDPDLAVLGRGVRRERTGKPRVLVSLGGGPRAGLAARVARAVLARVPDARVRIAAGLQNVDRDPATSGDRITWLGPLPTLAGELRACDVAVLAGGVTLYEACALGTPIVGLPVVAAQQKTITGFAHRGAVLAAPLPGRAPASAARIAAAHVAALLASPARARLQARTARSLVDGRGASRVARALMDLATATMGAGSPPEGRSA